jgi:hypothetical protein
LKTIKEENKKLSATEKRLKQAIKRKRLRKPLETIEDTMLRFLPKVELKRLTEREIFRRTDDWSFLENVKINDTAQFRFEILAKRKPGLVKDNKEELLVKSFPLGITEDCWIDKHDVPTEGMDVARLSWKQKQTFCHKLTAD